MLLLEQDYQIPGSAEKKVYLLDKKLSDEKLQTVMETAMRERAAGQVVDLEIMKKNKKFQKEQLTQQGYAVIEEVFEN